MPGDPIPRIVEGAQLPADAPAGATRGQMVYTDAEGRVLNPIVHQIPFEDLYIEPSPRFPAGNPNQGVRTTGGIRKGDRIPTNPPTVVHRNHVAVGATALVEVPGTVFGQQMLAVEGRLTKMRIKGPEGALLSLRMVPSSPTEPVTIHEFGPLKAEDLTPLEAVEFNEGVKLEFWANMTGSYWFAAIAEGTNI